MNDGDGPGTQLVGLLATIRWEAQFKLAKCCMRASKCHIRLGGVLGRAGIGAIQGIEWLGVGA